MNRYFILHKPYNMVSQFVSTHDVRLLGELDYSFPEGTHAIGRLDNHSEGLLIMTTNKKVTKLLFSDPQPHKRTYLVKVKWVVQPESIERLRTGVEIQIRGGGYYTTTPCEAELVTDPEKYISLPPEESHWVPSSWLKITLTEGKYHQVRKMVAAIGHKCIRLIRISIEELELGDLPAGEVREVEEGEFFRSLKLKG